MCEKSTRAQLRQSASIFRGGRTLEPMKSISKTTKMELHELQKRPDVFLEWIWTDFFCKLQTTKKMKILKFVPRDLFFFLLDDPDLGRNFRNFRNFVVFSTIQISRNFRNFVVCSFCSFWCSSARRPKFSNFVVCSLLIIELVLSNIKHFPPCARPFS